MIEILQTGRFNSVQDLGQPDLHNLGISTSVAMDMVALKAGNFMLGNDGNSAGLEIQTFPIKTLFRQPLIFAITGAIGKNNFDGARLSAWSVIPAQAGHIRAINTPLHDSRVYLCVRGGFDVPLVLGLCSTSFRGSFGGLEGRQLRVGDRLQAKARRTAFFPQQASGLILQKMQLGKFSATI